MVRLPKLMISLVALAASAATGRVVDTTNSYKLEVRFDPANGDLAVQGTLNIVADRPLPSGKLLLNDALRVSRFEVNGAPARVEPGYLLNGEKVPGGQALMLPANLLEKRGQRAKVHFSYDGRLTTDRIHVGRGVVSPRWTELTLESFWYPILFEEPLLRSTINLRVPEQYEVIAPGLVQKLGPGNWRLDPQAVVSGRITFALSNTWHVERRGLGGLVAALYSAKAEPRSNEILDAVAGAHAHFRIMFGEPRTTKRRITILLANADVGLKYPNQAFATGGDFIVMSNGEAQAQLDTLHHEVAHLWWSGGQPGSPDELLSESVSEYLALRFGEVRWGKDWLRSRRAAMARRSEALKPRSSTSMTLAFRLGSRYSTIVDLTHCGCFTTGLVRLRWISC
jgi:hypothetical protein